jgi:hypothetical protein
MKMLTNAWLEALMENAQGIQGFLSVTLPQSAHAQVGLEVSQHCESQRPHPRKGPSLKLLPDPFVQDIPRQQFAYED